MDFKVRCNKGTVSHLGKVQMYAWFGVACIRRTHVCTSDKEVKCVTYQKYTMCTSDNPENFALCQMYVWCTSDK